MAGKQILAVVIVFGLCAAFLGVGWYFALSQARILANSQKVRVQITTGEVHRHVDMHNKVSYGPLIRYRILTPGMPVMEGDQIFPIPISGGTESWARKYVDRFEVGKEYDGYVSTTAHPVAYLIASASTLPYLFVFIGGGILLWFVHAQTRGAIGGMRKVSILIQVLLGSNLALAVIHCLWIMI